MTIAEEAALGGRLEGGGGGLGAFGEPVVGRQGEAPEAGGGFQDVDGDFGFAFGGGGYVDDADELFFESLGVAEEDFLASLDAQRHVEQCAVGADVGGEGVFGDV